MIRITYTGSLPGGYIVGPDSKEYHFERGTPFEVPEDFGRVLVAECAHDYQLTETQSGTSL